MHHLHIFHNFTSLCINMCYILTESSKDGFAGLTAGVEISTFLRLDPQSHDMAHPDKKFTLLQQKLSVIELNSIYQGAGKRPRQCCPWPKDSSPRARGQRARPLEGPKGPRVAKTCESEGPKGPRTS